MSSACSGGSEGIATRRNSATLRAAHGLALAATPTFAILAALTFAGNGTPDILCMGMSGGSMPNSMGLMYALMSAFHAAPWLRLTSGFWREPSGHRP